MIDLWVPGRPKPKGRPRMTRRGRAYTPQATHDAESLIANEYLKQYGNEYQFNEGALLGAYVDYSPDGQRIVVYELGDSYGKSPLRGDVDNMLKLTLDALQGAAFPDDKAIHEVWTRKWPAGVDIESMPVTAPVHPSPNNAMMPS